MCPSAEDASSIFSPAAVLISLHWTSHETTRGKLLNIFCNFIRLLFVTGSFLSACATILVLSICRCFRAVCSMRIYEHIFEITDQIGLNLRIVVTTQNTKIYPKCSILIDSGTTKHFVNSFAQGLNRNSLCWKAKPVN